MLNTQKIIDDIVHCTIRKKIWVAYSGGVDSHVLLHLLAAANHPDIKSIYAIHIDHGLHSDSSKWTQHCAAVASDLMVEFCNIKVTVADIDQLGMEAAARTARYQAFQQQLTANDVLLTAQHQEDQAETLLLQLFRGAGPKGLAAMAAQFPLGDAEAIRPLLNVSQQDILAYAQQHQLQWIEDPSNSDTRWNRNYIRHTVWPDIEQRWPSAAKTISRSAEHCAEASELLDELAMLDLANLAMDEAKDSLPIYGLLTLSPPRCRNLLRYYLTLRPFPMPSTACLQQVIDEVCLAKQDSNPMVSWSEVEVRRYQDQLYIMSPLAKHDDNQIIDCSSLQDITLSDGRTLSWQPMEQGISEQTITAGLTVRFRQGGEQIQPQGHSHHKSVKNLLQEWAIPPWQRDRIPLLYNDEELVAVADYCVSDNFAVAKGEQGYFPKLKGWHCF